MSPRETNLIHMEEAFALYASPTVTPGLIEVSYRGRISAPRTVTQALITSIDDPETTDIVFEVEGRRIALHKAILKIRCQYFRSMFSEHWKESAQKVIQLKQMSYPVFRGLVNYIYSGEPNVNATDAIALLDVANSYCEDGLKKECTRIIRSGVNVQNVMFLYGEAIKYEASDLEEFCFRFISKNIPQVLLTDGYENLDGNVSKRIFKRLAGEGFLKG